MNRRTALLTIAAGATTRLVPAATRDEDVILRAMRDELARSRTLRVVNLPPPYFVSYSLDDGENFTVTATLGGVVSSRLDTFRLPEVEVRVGDYKFDNTNYVGTGMFGTRFDVQRFPLENDYSVLRRYFWLSTDGAYKGAVEAIARKRAALQNLALTDQLDDFARVEPVQHVLPATRAKVEEARWQGLARSVSSVFNGFPKVRDSSVEVSINQSTHYQLNSEGTELRYPDHVCYVRIRGTAQAEDGMLLHDSAVFHAHELTALAQEPEMRRAAELVAQNVSKLSEAPVGDTYNGPILFEGIAGAQLLAQVLGRNLALPRRPVGERGRNGFFQPSELEGRQGSRIMPEFMTVVDDPTQTEWRGRPLFGTFEVDREGVVPKPVTLVDRGVLKSFLLTRQPVRGFSASNGRAMLPGAYGASIAVLSNMFVKAAETYPLADLKKKLIEMCQNRNKEYGILVRRMDFPSSASFQEVRQMMSRGGQSGGVPRISLPVLTYRVYPDGREELIRGVRLGGLNARSLKDITAAGNDDVIFEYLDNAAPFALMGAGGYATEACVVAPSLLIDDIELHKIDEELPKLPLVPAP